MNIKEHIDKEIRTINNINQNIDRKLKKILKNFKRNIKIHANGVAETIIRDIFLDHLTQ